MSYIRSFRKILEEKNPDLYGKLINIEKKAQSLLTYTAGKFPYYTPHDFVTHSRNVEENLNWIVDDEVKETFNDYEIFFLLVAAWLHDWGMIGEPDEDPQKIRETHHLRTEKYLEKLYDKVYLSYHEARIIGKICRGHTKEDLQSKYFDDVIFGANIPIRVRFLAACLRIADECDITANRTPEIIYYSLNPSDKAEEEFKKHLSILGVGRPEKHKIQIFGIAWDPKGVKVLEKVRDKIQRELNRVKVILAQQGIVLDYIELKVDTRGFINKPIEFILDRKKIVELLIGKHLYSRKDSAIRELMQNAIDTCRLRKILDNNYTPLIKVSFSKKRIRIEDNGIGMSFEDAKEFLSKKGKSFYMSKEFEKLLGGKKFYPLSRFGIGILSCFLIASKVTIETKRKGHSACRFIIEDVAEGWRYEESQRTTEGTVVELVLNEEGMKINVEESLKHYIKKVEIPVVLINEETGESKVLEQQWNESMPEVQENIIKIGLASSSVRESFDIISEIFLKKTISTDEIEATYYCFKPDSPFYCRNNCFLSYNGIYVGDFNFFPASNGKWFVLINCTEDLIDLAISREGLITSQKNEKFFDLLFDNFTKLLEVLTLEKEESCSLNFCVHYANVSRLFIEPMVLLDISDIFTNRLMFKFELEKIYPVLDSDGLKYLKGKEIFSEYSAQVEKIYHYILPSEEGEYHIKLVSPFLKSLIKDRGIVVFDVCPYFSFLYPDGHEEYVLSILCSKSKIKYETLSIFKILEKIPLRKIGTPLDELLPKNSMFAEIPAKFQAIVIPIKHYKFKLSDDKRRLAPFYYRIALMQELFSTKWKFQNFIENILRHFWNMN